MQSVSVAVPGLNSYSSLVDARSIDPQAAMCRMTKGLGPFDVCALLVTLDPTATPGFSPNMVQLGFVRGEQGDVTPGVGLQGYPFFSLQRVAGTATGGTCNFVVSGPANGPATPAAAIAPVASGAFVYLSLVEFGNSVLVGLSGAMTENDVFNVYGTNDPSATGVGGASFIGIVQGGGDLTGTALAIQDFTGFLIERTNGSTAGFVFAYGPLDDNGRVSSYVATDQAGGNIVGPLAPPVAALSAQQLVDRYAAVEVFQTSGGGATVLTLAAPSDASVMKLMPVTNIGTAAFIFYGKTMTVPGTPQHSAATAVWSPGAAEWMLLGNT